MTRPARSFDVANLRGEAAKRIRLVTLAIDGGKLAILHLHLPNQVNGSNTLGLLSYFRDYKLGIRICWITRRFLSKSGGIRLQQTENGSKSNTMTGRISQQS
jgi:hypothetical protein